MKESHLSPHQGQDLLRNDIVEIRKKNTELLRFSLEAIAPLFLKSLDFSLDISQIISSLDMYDTHGNRITCNLLLMFFKADDTTDDSLVRHFCICIAPKGTLRISDYLLDPIHTVLESEMAMRTWSFDPDTTGTLNIEGSLRINSKHTQIGLGTALLKFGESIKRDLSHKYAKHLALNEIETTITDASSYGWTARRIKDYFPEYIQGRHEREFIYRETLLKSSDVPQEKVSVIHKLWSRLRNK